MVAGCGHIGFGQVGEELAHTSVFGLLLSRHDPQAGTTDHRVLGGTGHIGVVRQGANAIGELTVAGNVAVQGRRTRQHGAFARHKSGIRSIASALVNHQTCLGHVGQVLDVAHVQWRVEAQARIHAPHAIAFGGEFGVVPGAEGFQLCPADPAGGKRTFVATCLELGGCQRHLGPGGGWFLGVKSSGFEGVFVVVKHRRGTVEGKAQHLAIRCRVVARHGWHIGIGIERDACFFHDLADGHDGTLAGHHGGCAHLEHLQNVWCIAGTEGGNGGSHRLVIAAFEGGDNLVVLLAGVEIFCQVVHPFTQGPTHGMPPLDFGLSMGRIAQQGGGCQGCGDK